MKKIIILLIFIGLFIQGCSPNSNYSQYNKGFSGLSIKYNGNLNYLYEGEISNINLLLKNNGAYNINNGILKLSIEENYLNEKSETKQYFELNGGTKEFPEGESSSTMFSVSAKNLDEKSIQRETNFHITYCYDYGTDLSVDVCIDSDIYNIQKDKICTPEIKKLNGGQGAPVTISSIESRMVYDDEKEKIFPSFTLTIENKGTGTVIKKGKIDEVCSSEGIESGDFNLINLKVKISELGNLVELDCSQNQVKLRDNKKQIICKYNKGFDLDVGTYYTPLHINMEYGYMDVISKNIQIKKIDS